MPKHKIISTMLTFALLLTTTSSLSGAEGDCPNIKLPCSCGEATEIFTLGLNNDPYKVELADLERQEFGESCSASIKGKMAIGGIDFSEIFDAKGTYSINSFLDAQKTNIEKAVRKFPINDDSTVCVTEDVNTAAATTGKGGVEVIPAAENIDGITRVDASKIRDMNCLVYLPRPYISSSSENGAEGFTPHDNSYILSTLIKSGAPKDIQLAKDILDNFFYEISKFGYPIGGNRGYLLTESQNNIITTNILEYFNATKGYKWLEDLGIPNTAKIIEYWNTRIGVINLNGEDTVEGHRWIVHGAGPREAVWKSGTEYNPYYFETLFELAQIAFTPDFNRLSYAKGFDYNRAVNVASAAKVALWKKNGSLKPVKLNFGGDETGKALDGHTYLLSNEASETKKEEPAIELNNIFYTLTPAYYANDRALQVSGYYSTQLYGPWGAFVNGFVDAALNIQIFKSNTDAAKMHEALATYYEKIDKKKAKTYREKVDLYNSDAKEIKDVILKYLWNEETGMIFNYNSQIHSQWTLYPFASGAYAIWAGFFDVSKPEEVTMLMKMADYLSKHLEGPDGYFASTFETGLAWDYPNVQPIQQGMIIGGLRNYSAILMNAGMKKEATILTNAADRVALKYLHSKIRNHILLKDKEDKVQNGATTAATILNLYEGLSPSAKDIINLYARALTANIPRN